MSHGKQRTFAVILSKTISLFIWSSANHWFCGIYSAWENSLGCPFNMAFNGTWQLSRRWHPVSLDVLSFWAHLWVHGLSMFEFYRVTLKIKSHCFDLIPCMSMCKYVYIDLVYASIRSILIRAATIQGCCVWDISRPSCQHCRWELCRHPVTSTGRGSLIDDLPGDPKTNGFPLLESDWCFGVAHFQKLSLQKGPHQNYV